LDADIHGPSIPRLYGLEGKTAKANIAGVYPVEGPLGIEVMSIGFFMAEQMPTIWRGPLKMKAIKQFLTDVMWGELDYLLIDLPPGTGDEPLSIAQLMPDLDGAIIVTMPSELSSQIVKKAITFAENLQMDVLGVVENMSGFICPHCGVKTEIFQSGGGKKMAAEMKVDFLGSIPIDPKVGVDADKGLPFVISHPESEASKVFGEIVAKVEAKIKQASSS
jgi:ATP-binding protein involved in chromosome partitioning